jgi:hypothetical protein
MNMNAINKSFTTTNKPSRYTDISTTFKLMNYSEIDKHLSFKTLVKPTAWEGHSTQP